MSLDHHSKFVNSEEEPLFPQFGNLPPELRLHIWKYALPRGRTLKVKIDAYDDTRASLLGNFSAIPSICHVNSESRFLALSILRNGLGPNTEESDFYWNPNIDTIYFPPSASWTNGTMEKYLFKEKIPASYRNHGITPVVQHIAFPLNIWLAQGLYLEPPKDRWLLDWLYRFPALQSVTLLIEPFDQWLGLPNTSIVYHEPLDVPVSQLLNHKPSEMKEMLEKSLQEYRVANDETWEPPLVEILVLGMKKFRGEKRCIGRRTNLDRDDVTGIYELRVSRGEKTARRLVNRWPAEIQAVEQWSLMEQEGEEDF
ncbi:uncharacterized protein EAF01_011167 [Botrytis porri]|uniref:2EXR domain-containing protein n=1 Tax=Botrytis porri TaxID=87229 RepID=A0A4Z1KPV0_9HELO|nr:uncharacterized protein EAF01_011167 [Botrytis porri]KAF7888013.1 hypothetical protein EAF01_011167 [Botrytis porri]TGO83439.1 hypothetical protein BPOR_0647g00010 [Botrytis porri]